MATVTGYTAEKMGDLADDEIISGAVNGPGHLILTQRGGGTIDAGSVLGPQGDQGDTGPSGVRGTSRFMSTTTLNTSGTTAGITVSYPSGITTTILGDMVEDAAGTVAVVTTAGTSPTVTFAYKIPGTSFYVPQTYTATGAIASTVTDAIFQGSTASQTLTLPAPTQFQRIRFMNISSVAVTLAAASGSQFTIANVGGATSLVVQPGEEINFVGYSTAIWAGYWGGGVEPSNIPIRANVTSSFLNGWANSPGAGGPLIERYGKLIIISGNMSAAAATSGNCFDLTALGILPANGTLRASVWHDQNQGHTGSVTVNGGYCNVAGYVAADTSVCFQISYVTN